MRFRIFDTILPAEENMPLCNLGHLFNAYMNRLHTLETATYPMETLGEYHRLAIGPLGSLHRTDRAKARALRAAQERYYCLSVLNNSLHDLHLCVLGACNILSELFTGYGGNLRHYAIQNRLRCIADFVPGTEDELADMHPADLADFQANWEQGVEGQPWQPIYKDDEQGLAPYTVAADLAHFFAPLHAHHTIETIGATLPEEWDYFTEVVRTASVNRLRTSQLSENAGVYQKNAVGEYEQLSIAQRVQNEVNDELNDVRTAHYFQLILKRLQFAAGLSVMLTDVRSYRELQDQLVAIRDCTGLPEPAQPFV